MLPYSTSLWALFLAVFQVLPQIVDSANRTLYFLHTHSATWGSARDTCARYGAHLVNTEDLDKVGMDISILDHYLGWNEEYTKLTDSVWTGLYRPEPEGPPLWHGCDTYLGPMEDDSIVGKLKQRKKCAAMTPSGEMTAERCDKKLPYICEMDEGQCWFLPIQGKRLLGQPQTDNNLDQNDCAKECKNKQNAAGECWGMSFKPGECQVFIQNARHAYIRALKSSLVDDPVFVTYLKVCTGGEVTHLEPSTLDSSTTPVAENCTYGGDAAKMLNAEPECYCDCDTPPKTMDPEEKVKPVEDKMEKLVETLQVETTNMSSAVRKLSSATDERSSSKSMGVFGIAMLSLVFGGLIILDLNIVIDHVMKKVKEFKNSTNTEE